MLSFSVGLLGVIQVFTSDMYVCMVKTVACICDQEDRTEVAACEQQKPVGDRMSFSQRGERWVVKNKNKEDRTKNGAGWDIKENIRKS